MYCTRRIRAIGRTKLRLRVVQERGMSVALREGWRGRFFEDFEVGDVYEHPLERTVTTTDNMWFTLLSQDTAPIHVDR
jgi:acyl dehydratase